MSAATTVTVTVSIIDLAVVRFASAGIEALLLRRAEGMRCTGAWEIVHGRIEPGERPEQAAMRELREETALPCERLYNVTLGGFYLHRAGTLALTVVFCAIVALDAAAPVLGERTRRLRVAADRTCDGTVRVAARATKRCSTSCISSATATDAGAVEDVLRHPGGIGPRPHGAARPRTTIARRRGWWARSLRHVLHVTEA